MSNTTERTMDVSNIENDIEDDVVVPSLFERLSWAEEHSDQETYDESLTDSEWLMRHGYNITVYVG